MIQITNQLIRTFKPCYNPNRYLKETEQLSVIDFLKKEEIPAVDRLWVVLRTSVIEEKILRLHAVRCGKYAVERLKDDSFKSNLLLLLETSEKFALGLVDDAARLAARSAAAKSIDAYAAANAAYAANAANAAYAATNAAAANAAANAANAANAAAANAANAAAAAAYAAASVAYSASTTATAAAARSDAYSAAISALIDLLQTNQPAYKSSEGIKHDQEKPDMSLISSIAVFELAKVMTYGKKKYSANNWRGGIVYSRIIAAVLRHTLSWLGGESEDPETGLSHLAHAMAGLMMLLEFEKTRPDLDDRYKREDKK